MVLAVVSNNFLLIVGELGFSTLILHCECPYIVFCINFINGFNGGSKLFFIDCGGIQQYTGYKEVVQLFI
jgi:hypothetical protein